MTPQEIAASLKRLSADQLAKLDHASLYAARDYLPKEDQGLISPYEHRAFAREATQENPWMALPIAAGTVAYQPYKMLTGKSRSAPSLDQVGQGLMGVGEGLWGAFQNQVQSIRNRIAGTDTDSSSIDLRAALQNYLADSNKASKSHQQTTKLL